MLAYLRSNWKSLSAMLVVVVMLRSFVFGLCFVPTGSMMPTINPGDLVFVTNYDYGYSTYSLWPFAVTDKIFDGRIYAKAPARGDIVVIRRKNEPRLLKRLIGLPKDKIQFANGKMLVNDVVVQKEFLGSFIANDGTITHRYKEVLDGKSYTTHEKDKRPEDHINSKIYLVPNGHYFLLGDNRDNSADSRSELGCVSQNLLIAKARLVLIPTAKSFNPKNWNISRFFTSLLS